MSSSSGLPSPCDTATPLLQERAAPNSTAGFKSVPSPGSWQRGFPRPEKPELSQGARKSETADVPTCRVSPVGCTGLVRAPSARTCKDAPSCLPLPSHRCAQPRAQPPWPWLVTRVTLSYRDLICSGRYHGWLSPCAWPGTHGDFCFPQEAIFSGLRLNCCGERTSSLGVCASWEGLTPLLLGAPQAGFQL